MSWLCPNPAQLRGALRAVLCVLASACVPVEAPVETQPSSTTSAVAPLAERVLILKQRRELQLLSGGTVLRSFPIALGFNPVGHKLTSGDGRTPEGAYFVDGRIETSPFHRALHLSYPNNDDKARAEAAGVEPGSDIVIHGMPVAYGRYDPVKFFRDWTDGCVAVGNLAIEEIWALVPNGTPVEIRP
jgi:murein L,D-transpeptidase YafK